MSELLLKHFDLLATAPDGVARLRELILTLAVQGKLAPQDPNDEPASVLLQRIRAEKDRLIAEGKIKRDKPLPEIADEEKPYELPVRWEWVRLGIIGKIFNGNSINESEKESKYVGVGGLPYIATKDVGYGFDPLDYQNGVQIPLNEKEFKVAKAGSVLMCAEGGSAGKKCGLTDRTICFGNKLFATELHGGIPPQFLLSIYLSPTFLTLFSAAKTGIIGGVSLGKFVEIPVPLPPISEQFRIVARVEELMLLCDALEAKGQLDATQHGQLLHTLLGTLTDSATPEELAVNWQRVAAHFDLLLDRPEAVDALEQTILQLAVRGLLVPQDPEDEPASVLLQRIRAENDRLIAEGKIKRDKASLITNQETPFELPAGWEWRTLDACLEHQREISYGVIKLGVEPRTGGVPTLRCSDIKPGWINLSGVRKVSEEIEAEYSRTRLRGGEILLNIRGTLGGVALTTNTLAGYNVAREVAVIPINRSLNGAFFIYVMLSQYFWKAIQDDLRGIAYKGLNLGSLRTFPIPLPPLAEQSRIVARVEELRQLCNVLRQRLASSQTTQGHLAEALAEDLTA